MSKAIKNFNLSSIASQIIFWAGFTVVLAFLMSYKSNFPFSYHLYNCLINLPAFWLMVYTFVYVILPSMTSAFRILLLVLLTLVLSALASVFKLALTRFVFFYFIIPPELAPGEWITTKLFFSNLLIIWLTTLVFAIGKRMYEWPHIQREKHQLEKKNLESELQLLKAQLNPHFLFNTLNNIYSLAIVENAPKTAEGIMQISDLLGNIMYDLNAPKITLAKEVRLLDAYIKLQKQRYQDRLDLTFNVHGELEEVEIAPLLLFTFVENCFKHGSSNDPGNPWINIHLNAKHNKITFMAENSRGVNLDIKKTGIGLKNARKRLDLLYPDSHKIQIFETATTFKVLLYIKV